MSAGDTVVSDIGQQERVVSGESRPARSLHCGCLRPPGWCGGKGLFRADPPSTFAQKRPKGPKGRNACLHHRRSSRKSSPRGV